MLSYTEVEVFKRDEVKMLKRATEFVELAPGMIDGEFVRCHELARAVALLLGIGDQTADGWYGMVEHTWIWTTPYEPFSKLPNILDVYAPGRLPQVALVISSVHLPFEYRRGLGDLKVRHGIIDKLIQFMGRAQ